MKADTTLSYRLKAVMRLFDESSQPLDPREIERTITKISKDLDTQNVDAEARFCLDAELYAFRLVEKDTEEGRSPGILWRGPFQFDNDEGHTIEVPDPGQVNQEVIYYWQRRIGEVTHPYLKRRYAGLVWGLWRSAGAQHPGVEVPQCFVDATLELGMSKSAERIVVLSGYQVRALCVALSIKDADRTAKMRRAIIDFERHHSVDQRPGTWGSAYDSLISRKMLATEEEAAEIVRMLSERLERIVSSTTLVNPHTMMLASKRLGEYYARNNDSQQLSRVANCLRQGLLAATNEGDPSNAAYWSGVFERICGRWGLTEDEEYFAQRHRHFSELSRHTLQIMRIPLGPNLTASDIENTAREMLTERFTSTLDTIGVRFIEHRAPLKEQLYEIAKVAVLTSILPSTQISSDGRPVATIGSLENDEEGKIIELASQSLSFSLLFIEAAIDMAFLHHQPKFDDLIAHFQSRPLFHDPDQDSLLERCLGSWVDGDYIVFAHLAVTVIERAVRNLASATGGLLWRQSRQGGMNIRLLDDLLRDKSVLSVLDEDPCFHLRVVLTDSRGMNLRNNIAHGLLHFERYGRRQASVLFHALLLLALVIEKRR